MTQPRTSLFAVPPNLQLRVALAIFAAGLLAGTLIGRSSLGRQSSSMAYPFCWTREKDLPILSAVAAQMQANTCPPVPPCVCVCEPRAAAAVCPTCDCPACETCPPPAECNCRGGIVNECMTRNQTLMAGAGKYAKRVGLPAAERVNGMLIEELQSELNFRPAYAYGHTHDVEDANHLVPWLLGSQVDLNSASRRIFLNLGANVFDTSTAWFLRTYPVNFDEIHAFEITGAFHPQNDALALLPHPPNVTLHAAIVGVRDFPATDRQLRGVNILRFILEDLKIKAEDTLIVKMDIEGAEWEVLPALLKNARALAVFDELFVEVHYGDPAMAACNWDQYYPSKVDDALAILRAARAAGLRTHLWP